MDTVDKWENRGLRQARPGQELDDGRLVVLSTLPHPVGAATRRFFGGVDLERGRGMTELPPFPNNQVTPGLQAWVIVVRRGEPGVFRALEGNFEDRVVWDRRIGERRVSPQRTSRESRGTERRSLTRATWTTYGFILAPVG